MKCVEIEVDDQGQVTVGLCPPDEGQNGPEGSQQEESAEKDYMQPAANVDDALAKAKQLLSGQTPNDQADEQKGMEAGYAATRGTPMYDQAGGAQ